MYRELTRRRFSRAHDLLASSLADGALMLRSVINDPDAPTADRIKAAEVMFDRVLGRPRESIALDFSGTAETPKWQAAMAKGIVSTLSQAVAQERGEIVEGEIVAEDPKRRARAKGGQAKRVRGNRGS
jgi:hypothetical protein